MFLGLRTAIYPVNDLEKAKRWYAQALAIEPYFDRSFYVGFAIGGFELGLIPDGASGISGPQPLWGVANAADAVAHLLAIGASALEPLTEVGFNLCGRNRLAQNVQGGFVPVVERKSLGRVADFG